MLMASFPAFPVIVLLLVFLGIAIRKIGQHTLRIWQVMLLGALAGATYISVFVGRLDDVGHDGML
jgi:hypothetical protein